MEKWNNEFEFSTYLEENHKYRLYWNNLGDGKIEFGIEAQTTGWIAFGLSPNGQMEHSDIMIGWVDDNDGTVHLQDRHTSGNRMNGPIRDAVNNLTLIGGEQENVGDLTITRIRFTRDKCTTDTEDDNGVVEGTARVIWAFHDSDPTMENFDYTLHPGSIEYHGGNRGTQSVNLYHGQNIEVELEDDVESFDLTMDNWHVSSEQTTYVCRAFKLPEFAEKRHIVMVEGLVNPGNEGTVHHIVVYMCPKEAMEDKDSSMFDAENSQELCDSFDTNMPHPDCRGGQIQFGFAVGGGPTYYPPEAGLPFSGNTNFHYAFFEMHYDNPQHLTDIVDSSGMRIHHTGQLRQHDVGTILVGVLVHPLKQFIPPNMVTMNTGYCTSECTQQGLDPPGVTVFGAALHAHQVGTAMVLRHIRDGEELEPIAVNEHYDFNYQQSDAVEPRVLLPGDKFVMHCKYDTNSRDEMTWAGLGSSDEMCIAFMNVYPPPDLYSCFTGFSNDVVSNWITNAMMQGVLQVDDPAITFGKIAAGDLDGLTDIHWTESAQGQAMYESLWNDPMYNKKSLYCGSEGNFVDFVYDEESSYEDDIEPFTSWENPDLCSSINWDDWMPQTVVDLPPDEPADEIESSADPMAVNAVVIGVVLKWLLGL